MPSTARRLLAPALATALLCLSATASAQEAPPVDPPPPTRAQALFDEAILLTDQGQHTEACLKFRESQAAEPSVGTLLNVANCSVREGKLSVARSEYQKVLELNRATPDAVRQQRITLAAQRGLSEVEARLATVTLTVLPKAAQAAVKLVGSDRTMTLGAPAELPAGNYVAEISAPGYESQLVSIEIKGGSPVTKEITLAKIKHDRPERAAPPPAEDKSLFFGGLVSALGGVSLGITGVVLLGQAGERASAIRAECGNDVAPPSCPRGNASVAEELAAEGRIFEGTGYALLGVGGAALVTSVVLFALDAQRAPSAPQIGMVATQQGGSVWLTGAF